MDTNKVNKLAEDLSKGFPRSPRETLAGYVIAARTLDKCRATLVGTPGDDAEEKRIGPQECAVVLV